MKKYFLSHVDLSEIAAVTAGEAVKEKMREQLMELGALNSKKKPDMEYIRELSDSLSKQFFVKLSRRFTRRKDGLNEVYDTLKNMYTAKEYMGMFLYMAILYGFLEWQVPSAVALLPASTELLKVYEGEFINAFDVFMNERSKMVNEKDDSDEETKQIYESGNENEGYM